MLDAVSREFILAGGKLMLAITAGPLLLRIAIEGLLSLTGTIKFASLISQVIVIYVVVLIAYSAISGSIPEFESLKRDIIGPFLALEKALSP